MKNTLLSLSLFVVVLITSCGPAAEDREKMHIRAKVFQDSIANVIKQSMAEAEAPGPRMAQPAAQGTAAPQPTQAAGQTTAVAPNIDINRTK
jgi:hypothetical protein